MIATIRIRLENYTLPTFVQYDIYSYNHTEWFIKIHNNLQEQDTFTIMGIENIKKLLLLSKETLSIMFVSIILDSGLKLFSERCIIIRDICLDDVFNIYKSMDLGKKSKELNIQNENLRKLYLKQIPSQVKKEIIKYI